MVRQTVARRRDSVNATAVQEGICYTTTPMRRFAALACMAVSLFGCRTPVARAKVIVADTPAGYRCLAEAEASYVNCKRYGRTGTCMKLRNELAEQCPKPGPGEKAIEEEPLPQLPGWHP